MMVGQKLIFYVGNIRHVTESINKLVS